MACASSKQARAFVYWAVALYMTPRSVKGKGVLVGGNGVFRLVGIKVEMAQVDPVVPVLAVLQDLFFQLCDMLLCLAGNLGLLLTGLWLSLCLRLGLVHHILGRCRSHVLAQEGTSQDTHDQGKGKGKDEDRVA